MSPKNDLFCYIRGKYLCPLRKSLIFFLNKMYDILMILLIFVDIFHDFSLYDFRISCYPDPAGQNEMDLNGSGSETLGETTSNLKELVHFYFKSKMKHYFNKLSISSLCNFYWKTLYNSVHRSFKFFPACVLHIGENKYIQWAQMNFFDFGKNFKNSNAAHS